MDQEVSATNVAIFGGVGAGACVCITLFIGLLLFVILLPVSFKTVRYDEYGLDFNHFTQKVDMSQVYKPGRHYIGVAHSFIKIPRVFQSIDFTKADRGLLIFDPDAPPLNTRTRDGLTITLEVSFQYKLADDKVLKVFDRFALGYKNTIIQIARDIIRDVVSNYDAFQFFDERKTIGQDLEQALKTALLQIDINIEFLQLRDVVFQTEYENIIVDKEIQRQLIPKARYDQEAQLVLAETDVKIAAKNAMITKINAVAEAKRAVIQAEAQANSTMNLVGAYTTSYKELIDTMNMTASDLETYVWIDTLLSLSPESLILNLDRPSSLDSN